MVNVDLNIQELVYIHNLLWLDRKMLLTDNPEWDDIFDELNDKLKGALRDAQ